MRDWFESLAAREQMFVAIGAVIVAVSLLWGLIWVPLDRGHERRSQEVAAWQRSVSELGPLGARIKLAPTSGGTNRTTRIEAPVVIIDQTLRSRGLDRALKRSQPTTSNGIRVEFENVAFDELVVWLGDLSSQYSMNVQAGSFSAPARALPGRVNATMTLERAL